MVTPIARQSSLILGLLIASLINCARPVPVVSSVIDTQLPAQLTAELNELRSAHHLTPLSIDRRLQTAAQAKATALVTEHRFDHVVDNQPPWTFMQAAGYHYELAGENLAMDFPNSAAITQAWLASPTHRQNLLDPAFTDVGIATANGLVNGHETTVVVELFGRPDPRAHTEQILTTIVNQLSNRSTD